MINSWSCKGDQELLVAVIREPEKICLIASMLSFNSVFWFDLTDDRSPGVCSWPDEYDGFETTASLLGVAGVTTLLRKHRSRLQVMAPITARG